MKEKELPTGLAKKIVDVRRRRRPALRTLSVACGVAFCSLLWMVNAGAG